MTIRWMCLLVLALAATGTATETHGWAVVYLTKQVDPTRSYVMICGPTNPDCNTVYKDVETTKWFATRDDAVDFINGFWVEAGVASGPLAKHDLTGNPVNPRPMDKERIVGIYECRQLNLTLHQVGTHRESVTESHEKEVPTMEWRP